MANLAKIDVVVDLEPFAKLECLNTLCIHNRYLCEGLYCNLKHLVLDEHGVCQSCVIKQDNG